jgi:hypothetical protein
VPTGNLFGSEPFLIVPSGEDQEIKYSPEPEPEPEPRITPHNLSSVANAPPGPRHWPLKYTVDMAKGFEMMSMLEKEGRSRKDTFREVFGFGWWQGRLKVSKRSGSGTVERRLGYGRSFTNLSQSRRSRSILFMVFCYHCLSAPALYILP